MLLELVPYFATEEFRDANGAALDRARATYDEFASSNRPLMLLWAFTRL